MTYSVISQDNTYLTKLKSFDDFEDINYETEMYKNARVVYDEKTEKYLPAYELHKVNQIPIILTKYSIYSDMDVLSVRKTLWNMVNSPKTEGYSITQNEYYKYEYDYDLCEDIDEYCQDKISYTTNYTIDSRHTNINVTYYNNIKFVKNETGNIIGSYYKGSVITFQCTSGVNVIPTVITSLYKKLDNDGYNPKTRTPLSHEVNIQDTKTTIDQLKKAYKLCIKYNLKE